MATRCCSKCGVDKDLSEYYAHKKGRGGYSEKCKECAKAAAKVTRRARLDYYREYDRTRYKRGGSQYERHLESERLYCERNPEKRKARYTVKNAIRDRRLARKPCETCGDPDSEAHHDDYSRPLDVRWLCFKCHRTEHGTLIV